MSAALLWFGNVIVVLAAGVVLFGRGRVRPLQFAGLLTAAGATVAAAGLTAVGDPLALIAGAGAAAGLLAAGSVSAPATGAQPAGRLVRAACALVVAAVAVTLTVMLLFAGDAGGGVVVG